MDSVTYKIEQQILNLERGSIFFPNDFVDLGTPEAIRQSLTRLCKEGTIIRIAQGIYCYPEIEEKLGIKSMIVDANDIERTVLGKADTIEKICKEIFDELKKQGLTQYTGTEAEGHAYSVNNKISDGEIRNLHILYGV